MILSLCGFPLICSSYDEFNLYAICYIYNPNLYALPRPINMTNMIRQHTKFPSTVSSPRQTWSPGSHCPTAKFGPLLRGSVTNPMLITAFDAYLTPKSLGAVSLVHKYVNLKEPYNKNIKEKVTIKKFLKKKAGFTWNPQLQRHSVQKVFFKFNSLFVVLTFQIIY